MHAGAGEFTVLPVASLPAENAGWVNVYIKE